jgi:hypothetical protein
MTHIKESPPMAHEIEQVINAHVRVRVDYPADLTKVTILGKETAASLIAAKVRDLIAHQAARLEEVTSALKPFAREADEWGTRVSDDERVVIAGPACDEPADALFTVGDLRRARAVLSPKKEQTDV